MQRFSYQAITESGSQITGTVQADSEVAAQELIASRGYIPGKISKLSSSATMSDVIKRFTPVSAPDLILFTKQFRTMFKAGIPVITLLEVLENQTENPRLKRVAIDMVQDIRGGSTLHQSFQKHPKVFSPLYCSMVKAGETSGSLPDVLDRLIYIITHEHKVKKDITAALFYPLIVLGALFGAFIILLTFVVPKFVAIFERSGVDLPLPTKICMVLYTGLQAYWPLILISLFAAIALVVMFFRTAKGKVIKDMIKLEIPIVGTVFQKAAMSRFASIFSILQASGITVLESISILSGTMGNNYISKEFDRLREELEEGRGISAPLRRSTLFPPLVINMVAIGEESGKLEEMLREISAHYDYEVEYSISRMSDLLGPILIVALAVVVGFFALAIFLPMWDLTKTIK
ncbi:MAG: type II secretion system F family protein [Desulfovibrionales bacterium]